MSLKRVLIRARDQYVIDQVANCSLPSFPADDFVRYQIIFSGRVQHVGFRLELYELATKLQLTGFCRNQDNGDVLAELQGPANKIEFLLTFMNSLIRIKIRHMHQEILPLCPNETVFFRI